MRKERFSQTMTIRTKCRRAILEMSPDMQERLHQYLAGRSGIVAGDQLVVNDAEKKARDNQRLMLGMALVLLGAALCLLSKLVPRSGAADTRGGPVR